MLPNLIEIQPLERLSPASITVPGSKSITNRSLVLAALAKGTTTLKGALWSEDTQVMTACLRKLGFTITISIDSQETGNRTLSVVGLGGLIPNAGSESAPLELNVQNAGTAARFLSALVCLGQGFYRLVGVPRMHERPQAALFQSLRQLGYQVIAPNDRLPVTIVGGGPRCGSCDVSIKDSSQFASALLLCSAVGQWQVNVTGENAKQSPYVRMTTDLIHAFPHKGGTFQIEPDASGGSYFWAANQVFEPSTTEKSAVVSVIYWPTTGWQIDAEYPKFLPPPKNVSRTADLGDSIMTAITIAALQPQPIQFEDLGRLRVQECERVLALRTELTKCGATVKEHGDTLLVSPSELHGATIETYNDHRMAMCFSILGLKIPGIKIKNPACVIKTFPNFYQKLAAKAPAGLGAQILAIGPDGLKTPINHHEQLLAE